MSLNCQVLEGSMKSNSVAFFRQGLEDEGKAQLLIGPGVRPRTAGQK